MHGNTLGVSTHREPFSYTPWGFPEHGGFPASYTGQWQCNAYGRTREAEIISVKDTTRDSYVHL